MLEIIFFDNENGKMPVRDALQELSEPDQARAAANLKLLEEQGRSLREPHVKHLRNKLKELRFKIAAGQYRIFFFFQIHDKAILVHTLQKKTQTTPSRDIQLAEKRMDEWLKRHGGSNEKR